MADLVTSRVFTDGERGITAQKLNDIVGSSVIQPAFYTSKPVAPTADPADIALILKAGAYAQVPISALAGSATQAQIWDTRLRSFNAIGNPSYMVDQVNVGAGRTNLANGGRIVDRWFWGKGGTHTINSSQPGEFVNVPGTSYMICDRPLLLTLGTAQATLAAGDYGYTFQYIEGPQLRPLFNDVHSVSILIKSSVANLKFSYSINDPTSTHSYTKLCTIPTANTWTLVTIPNIPAVPPAGSWSISPGNLGMYEGICFGAGATWTAPGDGVWSNGGFLASPATTNFFGSAVGATVTLAFIQHEPGSICTTLMDKPFDQNLDECLRYYQKTYSYGVRPGTVDINGSVALSPLTGGAFGPTKFAKVMAKIPTLTAWSPESALINSVRDTNGNFDRAVTGFAGVGDSGFRYISATGITPVLGQYCALHYTADSGW